MNLYIALLSTPLPNRHHHDAKGHAYAKAKRPTAASTTDRKTPLCEVLAAAPLKVVVVGVGAVEADTETLPEAPATPATPAAPATGEAGEAVAPASLAAGVPAARPTLVPEVAKCIWGTASWVESSEVVVQPGAMTPVAGTWS